MTEEEYHQWELEQQEQEEQGKALTFMMKKKNEEQVDNKLKNRRMNNDI